MCFPFVGPPICGALLTGRYLWWAPALFCGVRLSRMDCISGLAYILVQAIALGGAILFVGVRFSFVRLGAGAARSTGGESEGGVVIKSGSERV